MERYTAWITTDRTCLTDDLCDVIVLTDKIIGYREGEDGRETPVWQSTDPQVFGGVTTVPTDGDHQEVISQAEALLDEAGWSRASDWEATATGYIATVTRQAP